MTREFRTTLDAGPSIDVDQAEPIDWIDEMLKEAFAKAQDPPPLRLADLLGEIALTLTRYLYFPQPATAMLIACWIAATYCFREFSYCGYVAIRSKSSGSGKTRLLDFLSALSKRNPPIYTSPTAAVLFRANQDVVLIDEVDRLRGADRQTYGLVLAVLNAGYASTGIVPRSERVDDNGKFAVVNHPVYVGRKRGHSPFLIDSPARMAIRSSLLASEQRPPLQRADSLSLASDNWPRTRSECLPLVSANSWGIVCT